MLGDQHLRVVSPGLSDLDLTRAFWTTSTAWALPIAGYALVSASTKPGGKLLTRLRRQWFAKARTSSRCCAETIFQQESPLVDTDASNKAADADAALQELGSDQVAFGYLTATVTVWTPTRRGRRKAAHGGRVIQGRGFVTIPETSTRWMPGCRPFPATPMRPCASPSSRR